jgi:hypothetical protein
MSTESRAKLAASLGVKAQLIEKRITRFTDELLKEYDLEDSHCGFIFSTFLKDDNFTIATGTIDMPAALHIAADNLRRVMDRAHAEAPEAFQAFMRGELENAKIAAMEAEMGKGASNGKTAPTVGNC